MIWLKVRLNVSVRIRISVRVSRTLKLSFTVRVSVSNRSLELRSPVSPAPANQGAWSLEYCNLEVSESVISELRTRSM